jgi:hypothetical protein
MKSIAKTISTRDKIVKWKGVGGEEESVKE